ncbi:hypothetical protein ACOSP7_032424 [Xanthoceras sorbifolium]
MLDLNWFRSVLAKCFKKSISRIMDLCIYCLRLDACCVVTCVCVFGYLIARGSSGIGIETVRALALRGVHVIMAVRNMVDDNKVKEEILKKYGDHVAHLRKRENSKKDQSFGIFLDYCCSYYHNFIIFYVH